MPITLGMLAAQRRLGPYSMSYQGVVKSTASVNSLSGTFNLGAEYSDRIVFVGIVTATTTGASSVSVGGAACTKIGGYNVYNSTNEWWYVNSQSGNAGVTVSSNFAFLTEISLYVYVLGGGALGGATPTIEMVNAGANNTNYVQANFAATTANDYFLANGSKWGGGATRFNSFSTNMAPLVTNDVASAVGTSNTSGGVCIVGPTSAASSVYIGASGSDSTKPIQISAIRIRKKP